nr:caspase-1-like [Pogona vitticeps]
MADQTSSGVRLGFVEGVSEAVIRQLLDSLLHAGVLNDEEMEEVSKQDGKRRQARTLFDHVWRKGPKASAIFLAELQSRDPYLARKLGLTPNPIGPPGSPPGPGMALPVEDSQPLERRNGIRLCPTKLFHEIQAKEAGEIYPIKDAKSRTRLALIICNIVFEHHRKREGAEVDLEQMTSLLEGLGYTVQTETNLTSQGITECLQRFAAREEHKTSDSTFVVLMSHGLREGLCGVKSRGKDSDILSIDAVFSAFNNKNCPALLRKPKVILIQACRGLNEGSTYVSDSTGPPASPNDISWLPEEMESDALQKVHIESDFICLYSTTPDNLSWRRCTTGSVFIVKLIELIKEHAWNCDLEEIFRKVLRAFENNHPLQMPSKDRTTLSRKFYLFPGH